MQFIKKNWATIASILGALTAIATSVSEYLANDKTPSTVEMLSFCGVALMTYFMKRPGDFTPAQADAHAEKAVQRAVLPNLDDIESVSQLPPAQPGDDA